MSLLQDSDEISSVPNLHIWDNAAFDSGVGDGESLPLRPISLNRLDVGSVKENKPIIKGGYGGGMIHCDPEEENIEAEIDVIEREIGRLQLRLDQLKKKKADQETKRRGRIVPAKFKTPVKSPAAAGSVSRRGGASLGPAEILSEKKDKGLLSTPKPWPSAVKSNAVCRRGKSLGPWEIASATNKSRETNREKKETELRRGIQTVGAKTVKRGEEEALKSIKPKILFQEEKNGKRPAKNVKSRIVPSRYSLAPSRAAMDEQASKRRKWSLPEAGNHRIENDCKSPPSIMTIAEKLPKIKALRSDRVSPRDSGCAKRVSELLGKKSHFGTCQALDFEEEEK